MQTILPDAMVDLAAARGLQAGKLFDSPAEPLLVSTSRGVTFQKVGEGVVEEASPVADSGTDLDELGDLIRCYIELTEGEDKPTGAQQASLQRVTSDLDRHFWRLLTAIVPDPARLRGKQLGFGEDERLLIDAGFLNRAILADGAGSLRAQLVADLSRPGPANHFYFTEFLRHRCDFWGTERVLGEQHAESAGQVTFEDAELRRLSVLQVKIYQALRPLFQDLPGISSKLAELLASGWIKGRLDELTLRRRQGGHEPRRSMRTSLEKLLASVLAAVKARACEPAQMELLDALSALAGSLSARMKQVRGQSGNQETAQARQQVEDAGGVNDADPEALSDFLYGEISLLKSRIDLRTLRGGQRRSHSVLTDDAERLTKPDVVRIMKTIGDYDRLPVQHLNLVIMPFKGDGFFDWDRSCLVLPLSPASGKEQAVCMAVASYRILIDAGQDGGRLKSRYEAAVAGREFVGDFPQDYCSWILKLGSGWRGALSSSAYQLFKDYIGPDVRGVIGPVALLQLTPEECRASCVALRQRVDAGNASGDDYYRLAVVSWRLQDLEAAQQAMSKVVDMQGADRQALFSLALIQRHAGQHDFANETLERVVSTASNTLWQVYAADLLAERS